MFVFIRLKSFLVIFWAFIILTCILILPEIAIAAVGINQTVSFQGKLVNSDGTNVANGDYNLEFKIYQGGDGVPGGGDETLKWTETRTGSNKVTVTDGIFRVNLGSVTAFGTNVDWNQDTLWLSINVGGTGATPSWDGEMNPFIRLTATPYAFNAQKVNGLTVTNTANNPFSSTTTLKIGDGKTVVLNNSITFSGTDGTTITFPNANDTVVVLDLAQTLTNKTIGSTGLVFSSASTDITTISNQDLTIIPNGTGNVGIGLTNPVGKFAVSNASQTAIGKALVIFDQYEAQDLFTASSSGITKFVLSNSGSILLAAGAGIDSLTSGTIIIGGGANTTGVTLGKAGGTLTLPNFTGNNAVLFATAGTGVLSAATTSTSGLCLLSGGGGGYTPSWSACPVGGGGSSNWTLDSANGVLFPINNTLDILLGGTATSSAKFGFLNINSGIPTASISGNLSLAVPTGATPANQLNLLNGGSLTIRISPGGDTGLADALQITKGGSILATGNTTFGTTPTSGAGNRMMWIPAKAAFRAGRAGGTHWDDSNIGSYSVAFGESARASGTHSFATGIFTVASGNYSAAFGYGNTASGTYAFVAGGNNSTAAGSNSLVLGNLSTANNAGSIVIGERADSNANNAIVIGTGVDTLNHLNSTVANSLTIGFNSTVGTLFVGPGSGAGTYGNVGIGTTSIEGLFKVQGAKTGKALAIFDETGDQAILTASASGIPLFTITSQGGIMLGNSVGTSTQCLLGGSTASWGSCAAGSSQWTDGSGGIYYNSGNVAIGTTDPSLYRFFVNGVGNAKALGVFAGDGNQDLFTASVSGTTKFLIDKTGNIGIGTTLPSARLHVVNNSTSDGSWNQGILVENTGGSSGEAAVTFKSALSGNYWFTGINGADVYDIAYGTGFFNSNVKFRINNNGQIGIGTTLPSATLDISGSASISGDLTFRNSGVAHDINIFDGGSLTFRTSVGGTSVTKAAMTITNSGNVGIGTTAPLGKLNVDGAATGKALVILNETGDQAILTASKSGTTRFLIASNGNVGIGTTNTSNAMLSVSGTSLFQDQVTVSNNGIEFTESDTNPTCASGNFTIYADLSENKLKKCQNGTVSDLDTTGGGGSSGIVVKYKSADETVNNSATLQNDDHLFFSIGANEKWTFRFVLFANSGTTPDLKAAVTAPAGASCNYAAIDAEAAVTTPVVTTCGTATAMLTGNGAQDVYEVVGTVVNGSTAGTVTLQWAQNSANASNTVVYAGSYMHAFILVGSDLAELYYTNESDLVPGMVVSLDKNLSAGVVKATRPYDTNVIGVVSTQPGLIIGESSERSMRTVPIALAGRIPVKVSSENGAIQAGDYLTSSTIPGVAMKATRSGPVIGSALEDAVMFDDHQGVVLMFVKNGFYLGSDALIKDDHDLSGISFGQSDHQKSISLSDIEKILSFADQGDNSEQIATFSGTLHIKKLKADVIDGIDLNNFIDKIEKLENKIASISSIEDQEFFNLENNAIQSLNSLRLPSLDVAGLATVSSDLRVRGSGLIEGILNIIDTLITNNLIVNGYATFLQKAVFKDSVKFEKPIALSEDSSGKAVIKKDSDRVDIRFKNEYEATPFIAVSLNFDEKPSDSWTDEKMILTENIFAKNYNYVITNKSKKGFTILLNKKAESDLEFSWIAFIPNDNEGTAGSN